MTILTNPPFALCRNKRFLLEMQNKKDAVILATFRFCNSLGNCDLIDILDWPEITRATPLAIYDSHEEKNTIKKPEFYEMWLDHYDEAYKDDYIATCNNRLNDVVRNKYLDPMFRELTPDIFIAKAANQCIKIGDNIRRKVFPKKVVDIYEKHKEQINLDTYLWSSVFDGLIKIRKEFFE